jgi:hypothetical protein
VIPTRAIDRFRCLRSRRAADLPVRALSAPIIRDGRLMLGERWLEHEFAETDYRHGNGPLRLRLVHVEWSRQVTREGDMWVRAEGVEVDAVGREGGRRQVLIRTERLPAPPPARKRTRLANLSASH